MSGKQVAESVSVQVRDPVAIFIGDVSDPKNAKTGFGLVHWCRERVAGQIRAAGCPVDLQVPDLSVREAIRAGARSLVIGVSPPGGAIPELWWSTVEEAAAAGMDIVSGLHCRLQSRQALISAANRSGARLIDVRTPPETLSVATGKRRSGKRLLTVGTDCAVGKKYSALSLSKAMKKAGMKCTFRATGQTGILIAGAGVPIDAVVADFVSGAAENLTPNSERDHWDVVEGQGSLFHPAYAGVSLGLLHGTQPDAIVVCHEATRKELNGWQGFAVPSIKECIERNILEGRITNPNIQCVGVCIDTSLVEKAVRADYLMQLFRDIGLPCVDPMIDGVDVIVESLLAMN